MQQGSRRSSARVAAIVVAGVVAVLGIIGTASGAKLKTKSETETIASDEFEAVTAQCARGTKAVSGGFESDIDPDGPTEVILPYSSRAESGREWTSAGFNLAAPGDLTSFAYCRDQKVKRRSEETTVNPGESETVTAQCPRGTKAFSGGFDNPDFSIAGPSSTIILPFESKKTGKREWTVSGRNIASEAGELVVQVNCHKGKGPRTEDEELSINSPGVHDEEAECRGGRRVVSGGFDYTLEATTSAFVFSSYKDGKRDWQVEALDQSAPATLTVYAYCEKKKQKK
jgi:hypothetical protein